MSADQALGWLIRDTTNVIRGPFQYHEVLQLLKKGQLKSKTELSRANSYWFAVEEKLELARFFPELGIKVPEAATQMTATLTQAADPDPGVEITQFTAAPTRKQLAEFNEPVPPEGGEKMEWLSSDMAEEFGIEPGEGTVAMGTRTDLTQESQAVSPEGDSEAVDIGGDENPEVTRESQQPDNDEKARQEMLQRATVKADTLPSEHKNFTGERPKPINSMMRGPEKNTSILSSPSNMVQVQVEGPGSAATILVEEEVETNPRSTVRIVAGLLILLGLGTGAFWYMKTQVRPAPVNPGANSAPVKAGGSSEFAVRKSLILYDLQGAKTALSEFEMEQSSTGKVTIPLAQALLKKELLFDSSGALVALQTAKTLAADKRMEAEIDNLIAYYSFDSDRSASVEGFRRLVAAYSTEPVYRYNLGLALIRSEAPQDAIPIGTQLVASLPKEDPLAEDAAVLLGWARESVSKNDPGVEAAFLKALEANPNSGRGRLGLAIFRLRKGGLKDSEGDFRAFLDSLPELDSPTRAKNFRKMPDDDFYTYARSQIRELNIPLGAAGAKPSPLIMAVDAVLLCIQSGTDEAGKILELAMSIAPGEEGILKAMGYQQFKNRHYREMIELLKDRRGGAFSLLLAKASQNVGSLDQAENYYSELTRTSPNRADGWSLLGDMQLQRGKTDLALQNFQAALQRDPLDIYALRGLDRLGHGNVAAPHIAKNLPF